MTKVGLVCSLSGHISELANDIQWLRVAQTDSIAYDLSAMLGYNGMKVSSEEMIKMMQDNYSKVSKYLCARIEFDNVLLDLLQTTCMPPMYSKEESEITKLIENNNFSVEIKYAVRTAFNNIRNKEKRRTKGNSAKEYVRNEIILLERLLEKAKPTSQ